ncbi:MAG: hypothetical protein AAF990_05510 [Bacteroidota bacterium]
MTKSKLKMTGFARFLLFLIIAAPIIFFGTSYYKGEDGIETLKKTFGIESNEPAPEQTTNTTSDVPANVLVNSEIKKLQNELEDSQKRRDELYLENENLKQQLKDKDEELEEVKEQLDKIKSAIAQ